MSHAWMPFYVGDYLGKTQRLSAIEHGAYMLLIMEYWQSGSLPNDDNQLARISRLTLKEWQRIRDTIAAFFQPGWRHHRVEEELARADAISSAKSEAGKAGAAKRWRTDKQSDGTAIADASQSLSQNDAHLPSQPQKDISPPTGARAFDENPDVSLAVEIWNETARKVGWSLVQRMTPQRLAALRARLVESEGIAGWTAAIDMAADSAFLRGDNDRGWKADFDFLCKSKNFTKLMEGGFVNHAGSSASNGGGQHGRIFGALADIATQAVGEREREADPDGGPVAGALGAREHPTQNRDLEIPTFLRRTA